MIYLSAVLSASGGIKVDHPKMSNGMSATLRVIFILVLGWWFQCASLGDASDQFYKNHNLKTETSLSTESR